MKDTILVLEEYKRDIKNKNDLDLLCYKGKMAFSNEERRVYPSNIVPSFK